MRNWRRRISEFCVFCLLAGTVHTAVLASEPLELHPDRKWAGKTVRLSLSESLRQQSASIKVATDIDATAESAALSWENVADIDLRFADSPLVNVSNPRSGGDGTSLITVAATSENLALFPEQDRSAPAYTRLFYDRRGAIVEADIVLNPFIHFSADGTPGTFDLQSVLTHEFGHVLGLSHSPVMSATMFGRISPNRQASAVGLGSRTLSASDLSAVRAIYGPRGSLIDCCAAVLGTVVGLPGTSAVAWAEDAASGRLVAASEFGNGSFTLAGFDSGRYRLLTQSTARSAATQIFERDLDMPTAVRRSLTALPIDADISLIGTNGELGVLPVNLSKGDSHRIFLGGTGLDPSKVTFGVNSRFISVVPGGVFPLNFGAGITAVAVTFMLDPDTPSGEYNIFVEGHDGARRYLLGAISVN